MIDTTWDTNSEPCFFDGKSEPFLSLGRCPLASLSPWWLLFKSDRICDRIWRNPVTPLSERLHIFLSVLNSCVSFPLSLVYTGAISCIEIHYWSFCQRSICNKINQLIQRASQLKRLLEFNIIFLKRSGEKWISYITSPFVYWTLFLVILVFWFDHFWS